MLYGETGNLTLQNSTCKNAGKILFAVLHFVEQDAWKLRKKTPKQKLNLFC